MKLEILLNLPFLRGYMQIKLTNKTQSYVFSCCTIIAPTTTPVRQKRGHLRGSKRGKINIGQLSITSVLCFKNNRSLVKCQLYCNLKTNNNRRLISHYYRRRLQIGKGKKLKLILQCWMFECIWRY